MAFSCADEGSYCCSTQTTAALHYHYDLVRMAHLTHFVSPARNKLNLDALFFLLPYLQDICTQNPLGFISGKAREWPFVISVAPQRELIYTDPQNFWHTS